MPLSSAQVQRYLHRIRYAGSPTVSLETLRELQAAHLMHVPFENLDIHRGVPIELANSYDKVVERNRGGFCYELNGLFAELLTALGFEARLISARVHSASTGFGPEFDHLAILVTLPGGEYLVDVGFGEFTQAPLANVLGLRQTDPRGEFVVEQYDANYRIVSKVTGEATEPEYLFTTVGRALRDFEAMCYYHQTSPASPFTQKRLCTRPTAQGRITVTGNTLKIKEGDSVTETPLPGEAEFEQALAQYFNLQL